MKTLLSLFIIITTIVLSVSSLEALTVGSPILPEEKGVFTSSFEGDYIVYRGYLKEYIYIRNDSSGNVIKVGELKTGEDVRDIEGESYLALSSISYSLTDNLGIFLKGGGVLSDWRLDWYQDEVKNSETNIESDWGVAVGGGIKAALLEFKNDWNIGICLSYLFFRNDTTEYTKRNDTGKKYRIEEWAVIQNFWEGVDSAVYKDDHKIHQWQAAIYLSKQIKNILPYVGVKYFDFRTKYEAKIEGFDDNGTLIGTEKRTIKTESDGNVGVFAGIDCQFTEDVIFSIEGCFVDEVVGSASLTLIF